MCNPRRKPEIRVNALIGYADVEPSELSQDQSRWSVSNDYESRADLGSAGHLCCDLVSVSD